MSVKSTIGDLLVTEGSDISVSTVVVLGLEERPSPALMNIEWYLTDSLLDTAAVYDSGQPSFAPTVTGSPGRWLVELDLSFRLPNTLNPAAYGSKFYLEWIIQVADRYFSQYEEFEVHPSQVLSPGLQNGLTMIGYPMPLRGVLQNVTADDVQPDVQLKFKTEDNLAIESITLSPDEEQSGGGLAVYEDSLNLGVGESTWNIYDRAGQSFLVIGPEFQGDVGHSHGGNYRLPEDPEGTYPRQWAKREQVTQRPSLDPLFCHWSWADGPKQGQYIGFSRYWFFNEQLLTVAESTRQMLERAFIKDGALERVLDDGEYADFMRMGRDMLNSLGETTTFDLSKPEGGLQAHLLTCVRHLIGEARALEEGLKVVDFGGQSTSANIDFASHYETLVGNTEGKFEEIKDYKRKLAMVGVTKGDGSLASQERQLSPKALGITTSTVGNAANNFYFHPYGSLNLRRRTL